MKIKHMHAPRGTNVFDKIEARTVKGEDCWSWRGTHVCGRPQIAHPMVDGQKPTLAYVSRLILSKKLGRQIKDHECACHSCDNPGCVNPDHLWVGTNADNIADRDAKGRGVLPNLRGESCSWAKLTEAQVRAIRTMPGVHRVIASRFNVSRETVSQIKRGERWDHI